MKMLYHEDLNRVEDVLHREEMIDKLVNLV